MCLIVPQNILLLIPLVHGLQGDIIFNTLPPSIFLLKSLKPLSFTFSFQTMEYPENSLYMTASPSKFKPTSNKEEIGTLSTFIIKQLKKLLQNKTMKLTATDTTLPQ